nr:hypothetical transcript [Hymenolepis microstoma]
MLRKRVELLKHEWGKRGLGLEDINTYANFKLFIGTGILCLLLFREVYRNERLIPILRSLSIQCKQPELHALGPYQESDVQISPKCISEIVILQRQLVKLIESFENYMTGDVTTD